MVSDWLKVLRWAWLKSSHCNTDTKGGVLSVLNFAKIEGFSPGTKKYFQEAVYKVLSKSTYVVGW